MEKESRIINPHKMDLVTTHRAVHTGQYGRRAEIKTQESALGDRPMIQSSSYQNNFPNWKNGKADTFIEKKPQYPVYSLPFRANSSYKETYDDLKI